METNIRIPKQKKKNAAKKMPLWRAARRESENAGCVLLCRLDILETRITVLEEYQPHV